MGGMNAPPGHRRFPRLYGLLAGLATLCSSASAEVAITNTFTPSTTQVTAQTTYAFTVNSTEVTALTNTGLRHTLSGIATIDPASATSTCGGTVTASGNMLTWAGGTIPAAPPNGTSSCTVTVNTLTNNTPGSYNTTIPAGAFTNDQAISNRYAATASFNSTPLTLPTFQEIATTPDLPPKTQYYSSNPWFLTGGWRSHTAGFQFSNPNNRSITLNNSTLTLPMALTNWSAPRKLDGRG